MKTTDFINKYAESAEKYEYDDEAGMVKNNLHTIVRVSTHLERALGKHENVPEWCQEKIAQVKGMIVSVMDYMISQHEMGHEPEVPGFDMDSAERAFAENLSESEGASMSSSVAVVNSVLGEKGVFSRKDVNKKLGSYGNMLTRGGPVKVGK
jgi:hypothetical protein